MRTRIAVRNLAPPAKRVLMMVVGLLVGIVKMLTGGMVVVEGSVGVCEGERGEGWRRAKLMGDNRGKIQ